MHGIPQFLHDFRNSKQALWEIGWQHHGSREVKTCRLPGPCDIEEASGESVWDRLEIVELSKKHVWEAYRENLGRNCPEFGRLTSVFGTKTITTSNHGNMLSRLEVYGYPSNYYIRELVNIPWLELPYGFCKNVTSAENQERAEVDSNVENRLEDPG